MNRAASLLAGAVAALMVGCQDGSIMDPTAAASSNEVLLSKPQPLNAVALTAVMREPGNAFNGFVAVAGAAEYQMTVTPLDPIPPNPQHAVQLRLNVQADVRPYEEGVAPPPSGSVWRVSGSSEHVVPIPDNGAAFLTKLYRVQGRSDGMLLNVRFRITLTGVELSGMWLEPASGLRAAHRN